METQTIPRAKGKANPRRGELRALSQQLQPLVKAGIHDTINEGLIALYTAETGCDTWHTFKGWKLDGYSVRKGEQGYPIWARPRPMGKGEATQAPAVDAEGPEGKSFFPVCYLFHAGQVERRDL